MKHKFIRKLVPVLMALALLKEYHQTRQLRSLYADEGLLLMLRMFLFILAMITVMITLVGLLVIELSPQGLEAVPSNL